MNKNLYFKDKTIKIRYFLLFAIFSLSFGTQVFADNRLSRAELMLIQPQNRTVTLNLKNVSIKTIFYEIQKQTKVDFLYNADDLKNFPAKTINVTKATLDRVLAELLSGSDYTYKVHENSITISKKINQKIDVPADKCIVKGQVIGPDKKPIAGATVLLTGTTRGAITDSNGKFSFYASVGQEYTINYVGMKTITERAIKSEKDIIFTLQNDAVNMDDVVITGYTTTAKNKSTVSSTTLKMDEINAPGLNRVDAMLEGRIPGMIFMQNSGQVGAAPKVRIRGTSTILGNQEPLWVVDGIIQQDPVKVDPANLNDLDFVNLLGNAISGLNADDIEQIDVLKDAAATAIYGARAANGVIVITTKKGRDGKASFSYSLTGTINIRPDYSHKEVYLMNSKQRVDVSREMFERQMVYREANSWFGYEQAVLDYKAGKLSFDEYNRQVGYYEGINTDWFDVLCKNSFSNKHTFSVSGGTSNIKYYASIGINDEKGVIKKEKNNGYTSSIKINTDYGKFKMQFGMQANTSKRHYTPQGKTTGIVQYAYDTSRALPAYNPDGTPYFYNKYDGLDNYPFNIENEMNTTRDKVVNSGVAFNAQVKYEIIKGFDIEATGAYSIGNNGQETIYTENSYYINTLRKNDVLGGSSLCPWGGEIVNSTTRNNSYTGRVQMNFLKRFGDNDQHEINASLGGEISSTEYNSLRKVERGYYDGRGRTFAKIIGSDLSKPAYGAYRNWLATNTSTIGDSRTNMVSGYITATYRYNECYSLNFNTRIDASNQFGSRSNEKLLPIWSVSGRWDIGRNFWKESKNINTLALKLSYGLQGNMLDNQTSKMIIEKGGFNNWFDSFTSSVKYFPNPDLRWETTHSYNAEITFSLFKNKIGGTVGYYYKKTEDAFLNKKVSDVNGVTNYVVNKGNLSNQGLEVTLNFVPLAAKVDSKGRQGFTWRFDPQIGQVVNKLVTRAIDDRSNTLRDEVSYKDYLSGGVELSNRPLNTFFSYRFKGLSSVDGSPIFYRTEEDNMKYYTERYAGMTNDEVIMEVMTESGTRVPVLQGGFSNYFGYRQFGLSFNFTYSLGNKMRLLKMGGRNNIQPYPERNMRREFVDRWRKPGDEAHTQIPGLMADNIINSPWWSRNNVSGKYTFAGSDVYEMYDMSDSRVVSGNYLKLQSLSLRYVLTSDFCKKIGLKAAYISLSGTNLFTIANKKLKGQDVTQSGSSPSINLSVRPNYSFTINITL